MGFTIAQDPKRVEAACQFQINADLQSLKLLDCSTETGQERTLPEGQLRLSLQLETSVLDCIEGSARFAVKMVVCGDPKDADDEPSRHLFKVACRYAVEYSLKPGFCPTQEQLDAFKEGNAVFHCWPYFRELLHNMTMRMGLQVSPAPFLRLAQKSESRPQVSKRSDRVRKTRIRRELASEK
jgi:hypothetical protein